MTLEFDLKFGFALAFGIVIHSRYEGAVLFGPFALFWERV